MDSAGIWPHSHGCPNFQQKCPKLKKPSVPNPSVIQKKLCGFVFRRNNNDNRVYRSESFRFIHKNDAFLPIGRASARSLEIPLSENYMDPVDHQLGRPEEPPYNEIVEKYNAPYYYSDTIKEQAAAAAAAARGNDSEPPYCSPCPVERRLYANHNIRKSGKRRDQALQPCIFNKINNDRENKWSSLCSASATVDQTVESCCSSSAPPQADVDRMVDNLLEPVKTIKLDDDNKTTTRTDTNKKKSQLQRNHFVSICRIENSPNGTLTNFSVVSDGDLRQSVPVEPLRQSSDSYGRNISGFPLKYVVKAPSSSSSDVFCDNNNKECLQGLSCCHYRSSSSSFRRGAPAVQCLENNSKNESCERCGKLKSVLILPIVSRDDNDETGMKACASGQKSTERGAEIGDVCQLNHDHHHQQQQQQQLRGENPLRTDCGDEHDDDDNFFRQCSNDGDVIVCEGNTEIVSCCPYHPLRIYSSYGGLRREEILWPVPSPNVPGYETSHFYSQVNAPPSPGISTIMSGHCNHGHYCGSNDSLCSKALSVDCKKKSCSSINGRQYQYSSTLSSSGDSSSRTSTSSGGASSSSSSALTLKDVPIDFVVNSDNNYLKSSSCSSPYLNSSEYKCQIQKYPFKLDLPLENQDWFHGAITRAESERILQSACEGSFLVRNCEQSPRNHYSLSIRSSKGFIHIRIEPNAVGTYTLGEQEFPSVPYLIHHFMLSRLPIKGEEHVKLLHPVITQFL